MAYVTELPRGVERPCMLMSTVDCIYEGQRTLCIDPNECVDCTAPASPSAPTEAIFYEKTFLMTQVSYKDAAATLLMK